MQLRLSPHVSAGLIIAATGAALPAQVTWQPLASYPEGGPVASAYDSDRQRAVLFSGKRAGIGPRTWEWSASGFATPPANNEPNPLAQVAMAYDSGRKRIVLFDPLLQQVYEWDRATWTHAQPATTPPRTTAIHLAYDPVGRRTLLTGDTGIGTWSWNGTAWTQLPAATPAITAMTTDVGRGRVVAVSTTQTYEWTNNSWTATVAQPGVEHAAYDAARGVVFGVGVDMQGVATWSYDGQGWNRLATTIAPPQFASAGLAFDGASSAMVLFGGTIPGYVEYYTNDTWLWDPSGWNEFAKPVPGPRSFPEMVYDDDRAVVLLFGGQTLAPNSWPMWAWNGTWSKVPLATPAPAGGAGAFAYDRVRGVAVWWSNGETWEWNGTLWSPRFPIGGPAARPANMCFDEAASACVLVTETPPVQTWTWDGTAWQQLSSTPPPALARPQLIAAGSPAVPHLIGAQPGPTGQASMQIWRLDQGQWLQVQPTKAGKGFTNHSATYDPYRSRIVVQGGYPAGYGLSIADETWEFDLPTRQWLRRQVAAAARAGHASAYHRLRREVVTCGGQFEPDPFTTFATRYCGETYIYTPDVPATFARFGSGCAGTSGVPALRVETLPWLGAAYSVVVDNPTPGAMVAYYGASRTLWGSTALPLQLDPFGLTGCTLYVELLAMTPVTASMGRGAFTATIPTSRALLGQSFYNQVFGLDANANPTGVVASDGAAAVIGER